jgi:hypothetical protein
MNFMTAVEKILGGERVSARRGPMARAWQKDDDLAIEREIKRGIR